MPFTGNTDEAGRDLIAGIDAMAELMLATSRISKLLLRYGLTWFGALTDSVLSTSGRTARSSGSQVPQRPMNPVSKRSQTLDRRNRLDANHR